MRYLRRSLWSALLLIFIGIIWLWARNRSGLETWGYGRAWDEGGHTHISTARVYVCRGQLEWAAEWGVARDSGLKAAGWTHMQMEGGALHRPSGFWWNQGGSGFIAGNLSLTDDAVYGGMPLWPIVGGLALLLVAPFPISILRNIRRRRTGGAFEVTVVDGPRTGGENA